MSEKIDQVEYAWPDPKEEQVVHCAILKGDVSYSGRHKNNVTSKEKFTVCGIMIPDGETLYPQEALEITCESCISSGSEPIHTLFENINAYLKSVSKVPA